MKTISIIICAYNEANTIRDTLDAVYAADFGAWCKEIVVVDNASTDGTRDILREIDQPNTHIIYQPRNMGKGTSIRTAIDYLNGDYAVIQDADLEYDPQDIKRLLDRADEGAIAVFGSRTMGGRATYKYAHAYWGVRVITTTMNVLFGGSLTDAATATKMVRSDVLKAMHLVGTHFDLDFELPNKLLLAGINIHEVPVSYKPRTYEEGKKIRTRDGLEAFRVMLRDRLRLTPLWREDVPTPNLQTTEPISNG